MSERATLDEVLEFANQVREAGAGNPLDALMPATPTASTECLVAKNLNFNCRVAADLDTGEAWFMEVDDEALAKKIGESLNLSVYHEPRVFGGAGEWRITLPKNIGEVAADFDKAWYLAEAIQSTYEWFEEIGDTGYDTWQEYFQNDRLPDLKQDLGYKEFPETLEEALELIQEMWPYIEQSRDEVHHIGIFNDKGELI